MITLVGVSGAIYVGVVASFFLSLLLFATIATTATATSVVVVVVVVVAVVDTAALLLFFLLLLLLLLLLLQKPHTWSPIGLLQIPHYFLLIPYHCNTVSVSSSGSSGLTASAGAT